MCNYCTQDQQLATEVAKLHEQLIGLPAGEYADEQAIKARLDRLNAQMHQLEYRSKLDPAACEAWKVVA